LQSALIPSAASLAALGGYAGYWLAAGSSPIVMTFEALVFLPVAACLLCIVGPVLLPSTGTDECRSAAAVADFTGDVHVAQVAGTLRRSVDSAGVADRVVRPMGAVGGASSTALVALVAAFSRDRPDRPDHAGVAHPALRRAGRAAREWLR
jgi:hypothetical protein